MTINEAAKYLGVSTFALRQWEKQGLITPTRTQQGESQWREYTKKQLDEFRKKLKKQTRMIYNVDN